MKKLLLTGSIALLLGFLIAGVTLPISAHDSGDGTTTPENEEAWEAMHQACENGDWEAMAEAAEEVHGEDFDHMPCHDEDDHTHANHGDDMSGHMGGGTGGHMDGGMMGGSMR